MIEAWREAELASMDARVTAYQNEAWVVQREGLRKGASPYFEAFCGLLCARLSIEGDRFGSWFFFRNWPEELNLAFDRVSSLEEESGLYQELAALSLLQLVYKYGCRDREVEAIEDTFGPIHF